MFEGAHVKMRKAFPKHAELRACRGDGTVELVRSAENIVHAELADENPKTVEGDQSALWHHRVFTTVTFFFVFAAFTDE